MPPAYGQDETAEMMWGLLLNHKKKKKERAVDPSANAHASTDLGNSGKPRRPAYMASTAQAKKEARYLRLPIRSCVLMGDLCLC